MFPFVPQWFNMTLFQMPYQWRVCIVLPAKQEIAAFCPTSAVQGSKDNLTMFNEKPKIEWDI